MVRARRGCTIGRVATCAPQTACVGLGQRARWRAVRMPGALVDGACSQRELAGGRRLDHAAALLRCVAAPRTFRVSGRWRGGCAMRSDDLRVAPAVEAIARAPTGGVSFARADGDRAAGSVLGSVDVPYCRHQQMVYRYCLRMLRSPGAAADATQSTWLPASVVLSAPDTVVGSTHSWLRAVARDECLEVLRAATAARSAIGAQAASPVTALKLDAQMVCAVVATSIHRRSRSRRCR